uniref:Uncharacterized protein n=1 Tax=viral metagenome TaxID=1070528 RepID=A0A6C0DE89_9ZZZZ
MKNTEIIIQFIPIILIFTLLKFSKYFVNFSFTILGKLLAVLIIIFYSAIDIMVGLCVCGLVILYYQSDYVENMLNISDVLEVNDLIPSISGLEIDYDTTGIPDDGMYLVPMVVNDHTKKRRQGKKQCKSNCNKCEGITNYSDIDKPDLIDEFKKQHCVGGELKYKDMTVKNDMTEHVFSELKYYNSPCNACNNTCKYSIIEGKIKTEEKMTPISTSQ